MPANVIAEALDAMSARFAAAPEKARGKVLLRSRP